jgi:hypothetical protein
MKKRKVFYLMALIVVLLVFILFLVRAFGSRELDDVSPGISCSDDLIEKSDVLWVVPKFNGIGISENKEWCARILSLNKTIGMHGVYHSYEEFGVNRNLNYFNEGVLEFENCFGFKPNLFKPPQLAINSYNKKMISWSGLAVKDLSNQFLHRVYHCSDSGKFRNWMIDLF